jgi:hypothetical protein
MLDKMACETEGAQDFHSPKGREQDQDPIMRRATRSINCSKNLKILTPAELSDSDKENVNFNSMFIINRPCGSALSPHAFLGKVQVTVQRRLPLTTINADVRPDQTRRLAQYKPTTERRHALLQIPASDPT